MDMFNLPSYTKGKTFAEASKLIAKKFEGRTDKESVDTLQDLQGRLQQAQEYIKKQSQSAEQQQIQSPTTGDTNDHFLGGLMSQLGGAEGPGPGAYIGAAAGALELGKMAFGKPDIDTSGKTDPGEYTSAGAGALGGALKGSQAGSVFGPLGLAIGGVLGGAAGFIGGKKAKEAQVDAKANYTYSQAKAFNNKYSGGGFMDNIDPNELISMLNSQENTNPGGYNPNEEDDYFDRQNQFKKMGLDDASLDDQEIFEKTQENSQIGDWLKQQQKHQTTSSVDSEVKEPAKAKYDPSTLLRYAPAITDAYQLATLEKPDEASRSRLGNKYQSQQVDETSLVKKVQEGVNNNRDAILSSSGGSQAAARANLLGLSLQGTKALSSAMQSASEANRQDNRAAQQFNLGVDQTNLQQSNAEQLANEQNEGAYDTQKSQLISQLGSNLGEIGKEQLFKKYPELMGMDFNALGKYINSKKKNKK